MSEKIREINQDDPAILLMSLVFQMDSGMVEEVKQILLSSELSVLYEVIESVYAIDVALVLESFSEIELLAFIENLDSEHMALILEQSGEKLQKTVASLLSLDTLVEIFGFMSSDDIADMLGCLHTDLQKELLTYMREGETEKLQDLLQYGEDTAGGIMTTEYISLYDTFSAKEALEKIKKIGLKTEVIEVIFVVNHEKKLVGTADLRDILVAEDEFLLRDMMDDNIVTVNPYVDQEEVSNLVSKYDLKAISVVNRKGSLLGIVTVDDIIDVLVEEQTEDMLKFGGVSGEEGVYSSVFSSVKVRLPWLLVNLCTASFSAFVISRFEGTLAQVVALSAVMPIVAATSGNSGSQTLAIMIRGITLGELNLRDDWKRVGKEIAVGMVNSCVTGGIASLMVFFMFGNLYLSFILFLAMFFNSLVSSTCGFFIPLTLKACGLDPALASSIFLTAATDVMAFMIFLALATLFLPHLI